MTRQRKNNKITRYVAIRSDLEKAELERAAVFDALRETRAVLSDVRRQRDEAEKELQTLRAAPQFSVRPNFLSFFLRDAGAPQVPSY